DGDGVNVVVDTELEVELVLLGERGRLDVNAGEVDALVLAKHAAVDHRTFDIIAANGGDAQLDEPVGEQDAGAGGKVFGECGKCGADQHGGAGDVARRDGERLAGGELHRLLIHQLAGADLRSLQVT